MIVKNPFLSRLLSKSGKKIARRQKNDPPSLDRIDAAILHLNKQQTYIE
jgi:hypothetical protein